MTILKSCIFFNRSDLRTEHTGGSGGAPLLMPVLWPSCLPKIFDSIPVYCIAEWFSAVMPSYLTFSSSVWALSLLHRFSIVILYANNKTKKTFGLIGCASIPHCLMNVWWLYNDWRKTTRSVRGCPVSRGCPEAAMRQFENINQGCRPWGCRGCNGTPRFWHIS